MDSRNPGIWMWSKLIPLSVLAGQPSKEEEEDVEVLLLESQGLNAPGFDQQMEAKLFVMNVLLSSNLVFNQLGQISDSSLKTLSVVHSLSQVVKLSSVGESATNYKSFFPDLTLVLRDFSLGFKHVTPESYLEQNLEQERAHSDEALQRNVTRQVIRKAFPFINCVQMSKPLDDDSLLENLESVTRAHCKPEFLEQFDDLLQNKLRKTLRVKELGSRPLTGYMLLGLALEFVETLN
mmetsp:Transcript_1622/g.2867  ORF Transcript_1622/g.2867 Transcript_1622/m.2867 type:complete len:236 (+) Transcript_1622:248-955(+)